MFYKLPQPLRANWTPELQQTRYGERPSFIHTHPHHSVMLRSCLWSSFRLYVNWRFLRGIEAQFLALQKGFNEVIPQHLLKAFDEKELEVLEWCVHLFLLIQFKLWVMWHDLTALSQLIVCGLGKIDVNDWKSNTRLKHCTPDSNIVKWFWRAVESFDEERRARLLQFVTGSSRVPLQGFKALQGASAPSVQ